MNWKRVVLVALIFPASTSWSAKPVSFDARVRTIEANLSRNPAAIAADLAEFARAHAFVAYPGSPGIQRDVFTENFEGLRADFGVDPSEFAYRDVRGAHARYASTEKRIASVSSPPRTATFWDSERWSDDDPGGSLEACPLPRLSAAAVAAREAAFLRRFSAERGKPLIVMCHSAFCETMLEAVLLVWGEPGGEDVIDSVFYIEGTPPRATAPIYARLDASLARAGQACGVEDRVRLPSRRVSAAAFFVGDGGTSRNNFAPADFGTYLGQLQTGHIEAAVSQSRAQRSYRYRRALTQALMEEAFQVRGDVREETK